MSFDGGVHPHRGQLDEDDETNGIDDIELKEEYSHGPDIRALNASIINDPCFETVELSERTVKGRGGGKAGPAGMKKLFCISMILVHLNFQENVPLIRLVLPIYLFFHQNI